MSVEHIIWKSPRDIFYTSFEYLSINFMQIQKLFFMFPYTSLPRYLYVHLQSKTLPFTETLSFTYDRLFHALPRYIQLSMNRRRDISSCLKTKQSHLRKYSNGSIAIFCFEMWFIFEHVLRYFIIDNNYKLLITFQRVNVYLKEPIEIDELIKLANQLNQQVKGALVIEAAKITIILIFKNKK